LGRRFQTAILVAERRELLAADGKLDWPAHAQADERLVHRDLEFVAAVWLSADVDKIKVVVAGVEVDGVAVEVAAQVPESQAFVLFGIFFFFNF